ncbi:hypothetical protein [Parabacteroides sp. PF5-9]|uniref:DUF6913 domain-containing protein n=1 Tax=Parabacteroides sp. PF5-9 TaxID=1742404 RepID=UPI00247619B0|nr:hypothetical protein [Parabacteroides sp. PF5-9]MDH6356557.1 hypothetical protein [Parabacteroides sp. PF5-9]
MKVSDFFLKRSIHQQKKKLVERKPLFVPLKEARHILVFYNIKDQKMVEAFLESFRMMHKHVTACVYIPDTTSSVFYEGYIPVFAKTDLNRWGLPKDEIAKKINKARADILIDLTSQNNFIIQYLMLQHPSKFKVGLKWDDQNLHDFSITVTDRTDVKYLFGQILFYLQSFHSK